MTAEKEDLTVIVVDFKIYKKGGGLMNADG